MITRLMNAAVVLCFLAAFAPNLSAADDPDWRGYVVRCLDTLIEKGTYRYGPADAEPDVTVWIWTVRAERDVTLALHFSL